MSRKNIILIAGAIVVIAILLFLFLNIGKNSLKQPTDSRSGISITIPPEQDTRIVLEPKNGAVDPGNVTLMPQQNLTVVDISMAGIHSSPFIAGIYSGSCITDGDQIYQLENIIDGQSVTTLSITTDELEKTLPLSIKVSNGSSIIACGDITTKAFLVN
jgi:hypothetical protein